MQIKSKATKQKKERSLPTSRDIAGLDDSKTSVVNKPKIKAIEASFAILIYTKLRGFNLLYVWSMLCVCGVVFNKDKDKHYIYRQLGVWKLIKKVIRVEIWREKK